MPSLIKYPGQIKNFKLLIKSNPGNKIEKTSDMNMTDYPLSCTIYWLKTFPTIC